VGKKKKRTDRGGDAAPGLHEPGTDQKSDGGGEMEGRLNVGWQNQKLHERKVKKKKGN